MDLLLRVRLAHHERELAGGGSRVSAHHPFGDYARHVQVELDRDPTLVHPSYAWCLVQVERHMSYVVGGGADTREKKMAKLVEVIRPLARKRG